MPSKTAVVAALSLVSVVFAAAEIKPRGDPPGSTAAGCCGVTDTGGIVKATRGRVRGATAVLEDLGIGEWDTIRSRGTSPSRPPADVGHQFTE